MAMGVLAVAAVALLLGNEPTLEQAVPAAAEHDNQDNQDNQEKQAPQPEQEQQATAADAQRPQLVHPLHLDRAELSDDSASSEGQTPSEPALPVQEVFVAAPGARDEAGADAQAGPHPGAQQGAQAQDRASSPAFRGQAAPSPRPLVAWRSDRQGARGDDASAPLQVRPAPGRRPDLHHPLVLSRSGSPTTPATSTRR